MWFKEILSKHTLLEPHRQIKHINYVLQGIYVN